MNTSKILITIGLVLSVLSLFVTFINGVVPILGLVLTGLALWYYFKERDPNNYAMAFIILGIVYLVFNFMGGRISIDGTLFLIGGLLARNNR